MNQRLTDKLLLSSPDVTAGRFTYGQPKILRFPSAEPVQIGSFCSIADGVTFVAGGEHYTDRLSTYPFNLLFSMDDLPYHEFSRAPRIIVGHDVWIGYGATILSGACVGTGCIIGAGCVVAGTVEPYSIVIGNPARLVRKRFSEERISELLESKWWDLPLEDIFQLIKP